MTKKIKDNSCMETQNLDPQVWQITSSYYTFAIIKEHCKKGSLGVLHDSTIKEKNESHKLKQFSS